MRDGARYLATSPREHSLNPLRFRIVESERYRSVAYRLPNKALLASELFGRVLSTPLEGRVRLRHKTGDTNRN